MTSTLRRFFVYVLLVLLPLQATAVVTVCPHSQSKATAPGAVTAAVMDGCLHGQMSADADQQAGQGQDNENQQSCCATVAACAMCTIAANMQRPWGIESPQLTAGFFHASRYTSFIPEGLQRPPSILA